MRFLPASNSQAPPLVLHLLRFHSSRCLKIFLNIHICLGRTKGLFFRKRAVLCKQGVDRPVAVRARGWAGDLRLLFPFSFPHPVFVCLVLFVFVIFLCKLNNAIVWLLSSNKELSLSKNNLSFPHHQNGQLD